MGIAVAFFVYALYLFGFFSSSAPGNASKEKWSFFKGKEDPGTDWLGRRERVKEAFTISWDAYEKHGWGTFTSTEMVL